MNYFLHANTAPMNNYRMNYPNVSTTNTIEATNQPKGNIQDFLKDPVIAAKRKENHQNAMKRNANALKHGKYSKYHQLSDESRKLVAAVDELDFSDTNTIEATQERLIKSNLRRIAVQEQVELAHGGMPSQNLSKLIKDTFIMVESLRPKVSIKATARQTIGLTDQDRVAIQNASEEERQQALAWIKKRLLTLESQ